MPSRLKFEQWVPFPIEQLFTFFADPNNLPRIMPPSSGTKVLRMNLIAPQASSAQIRKGVLLPTANLAGTGSTIVTSFRVFPHLPFRMQWTARITEFQWNHHFADIQEKGPFKKWNHRHQFAAVARNGVSGTIVRDLVEYEIGFGFLGDIAERLFVARAMQHTFAHRQAVLKSIL
jgi:ligand-binding SRPBCC domain-containing protein